MAEDKDIDALDDVLARRGIPQLGQVQPPDEQPPRLSIGQRIAGVKPEQPAPTEVASNQPTRLPFDPNLLPPLVRRPQPATPPSMVPTPPTLAQDQDFAALAKKQAVLSTPINPYDPQTKQIKPEYKMGWGQRLLGTLANAATGFGGKGGEPIHVGPGATNWRYGREEQARQGALEGVSTQIKTQEQMASENEKMYRDALRQAYEGQRGEAALETAQARKETADVRKELADTQRDQGPKNKTADDFEERKKIADQLRLQGEERKSYLATGKLPGQDRPPKQPSELELWMDAFKRDNNRPPTAEEIANRRSRKDTNVDKITKDRDAALEKAERRAEDRLGKLKIFDPADKRPIAERKQQIYDDLEKDKAAAVKDYQERAAQNAGPESRPTATRNARTAPKTPPKVGETIMVEGKPHRVTGFNPQTKKPIVEPVGGQ